MKYTQPSDDALRKALEMRLYWKQQGVWPESALRSLGIKPTIPSGWDDVVHELVRIQGG